jgi:hypothetical protein
MLPLLDPEQADRLHAEAQALLARVRAGEPGLVVTVEEELARLGAGAADEPDGEPVTRAV